MLRSLQVNRNFFSREPKCPPCSTSACDDTSLSTSSTPPVESKPVQKCTTQISPEVQKFQQKQILFQKDNGLPVHLKGGPADRMLMNLTFALCGIGLLGFTKLIYDMIAITLGLKERPE